MRLHASEQEHGVTRDGQRSIRAEIPGGVGQLGEEGVLEPQVAQVVVTMAVAVQRALLSCGP